MNLSQAMQQFLVSSIPEAHDTNRVSETSTFVTKQKKCIERSIFLFSKIDNKWVTTFALYATQYFNGNVHLELVDSLQYQTSIIRTRLYHTVLLAYFHTCKCRGLSMVYFHSCPPGDDSYIFHDKPANQKQLSSDRLLAWYHKFLIRGYEEGIFSEGSNFVGCKLEEIPDFLVAPEGRNEGLDRACYFRVALCRPSVVEQTELRDFDTAFHCPEEFKSICIHNNISFSTLDGAKSATRMIINSLNL